MKNNFVADFEVNKANNTLTVRREFAAPKPLVWDCYTKKELLEKWFAPAPLKAKTKSMDFREGGHWHYCMVEPTGVEHWGYTGYKTIKPIDYYTSWDAWSDAEGNLNNDLPKADWQVTFRDKGANAEVETIVTYASLADLEQVVNMGVETGFNGTMASLDAFLESLETEAASRD